MANILLGVTGSVAAVRMPLLFRSLCERGHAVRIVATSASLHFFDPLELDPLPGPVRNPAVISLDEDEWPEGGWHRDDPVLHIELRRWADLLVIAPLDANTLAKLANGICDNCLTCVWRAWDQAKPIVLAPAMNTLMWEHPLTAKHLREVAALAGVDVAGMTNTESIINELNAAKGTIRVASPQSKRLACGDTGVGAMAEVGDIVELINA